MVVPAGGLGCGPAISTIMVEDQAARELSGGKEGMLGLMTGPTPSDSGAAATAGSATNQEAGEPKPTADPVKDEKMEGQDAGLKGRLKGKGGGGNKPRPTETAKTTTVEKSTES